MGQNHHAVVMRAGPFVSYALVQKLNRETVSSLFEGHTVKHLVSDRGFAFGHLKVKAHQFCLAHLLRNIRGLAEHPATRMDEVADLGYMYELIQELLHEKHRLGQGALSESTWRSYSYRIWAEIGSILENLQFEESTPKVKRFCKRVLKDKSKFMTYLRSRDGPMTNNPAEESLRNLVIARKLCFGSRSSDGLRWRASIQSCTETLNRASASVWDFLTQALKSSRFDSPYPDIQRAV